jgi:pyruvate dehydrogenase E1 component beta subunit
MPATAQDARDLLIASVLCDDPVMFIDDRWLYEQEDFLGPVRELDLRQQGPEIRRAGRDISLISCSHPLQQCLDAAKILKKKDVEAEIVDLRVLNPLNRKKIVASVQKTGRLLAVDGDWATCGIAAEVLASASEGVDPKAWKTKPCRLTLPHAPAPTSKPLEQAYYFQVEDIVEKAERMVKIS